MSTLINELPTDSISGGTINGNISLSANEQISNSQISSSQYNSNINNQNSLPNNIANNSSLDPNIINQIINGINQASLNGSTSLQTRDIPMNTISTTIDEQITPNYIQSNDNDMQYINDSLNEDNIINNYNSKQKLIGNFESLYEQLQTPILLAILYFIFQLPILKKISFKFFPLLFSTDGNSNIKGYFGFSLLFGITFFILNKIIINLNQY